MLAVFMSCAAPDLGSLKGVIFDLDGVLFDSRRAVAAFYNHMLELVGLPPRAEQEIEVLMRESMENSLLHLMGPGIEYDRAMQHWQTMDTSAFIDELALAPYTRSTLARLRESFILAVATNRSRTAQPALARFDLVRFFDLVVTPHEARAPKPDPHMMEVALNGLGLKRGEAVYIGDSMVDEHFCRAAGVPLVAFGNPDLKAWMHVDELRQLPRILGIV